MTASHDIRDMSKHSLFRRLIPPLVVVIGILTAIITWVGTVRMNVALADRARRRADSLAASEHDSLLRLMRSGDHRDLQAALEPLGRNPDVAALRLLGPDGRILASSRAAERGGVLGDHLAQRGSGGDLLAGDAGPDVHRRGVIHVTRPFLNDSGCQSCHGTGGPVIAWLDLDVDVNEHAIGFATFTTLSAALGAFYLLAAIAILVPGLSAIVVRPLRRLTDAMRQVRDGDLAVSVAPAGTREIDTVVGGFNRMVVDLRNARASEEEARRLQLERVEQLAVVGELAAGLAHEVRNPLSGVKAVLDVLERESGDPSRRDVLRDASGELVRIDQILRELLQFARPKPPALVPFDLDALVRNAVALTVPADADAPRIRCEIDGALPAAMGDAGQVRQVLVNLLLNAQHASGETGEVVISTGRHDGQLWCRVRDTGAGVPAEKAETIFRPFVTTKTRGTGLGLSISRRIVELHGGRLALDNPGEPGASFTFTLPVAPSAGS